jgi:EAL domain-containing protein (putative c-di-GMP-specific phosphodiesterase class I)
MGAIAASIPDARSAPLARGLELVLSRPEKLTLAFQPIVDLAHGVLAGYECLARFAVEPFAPPDQWFAAALELGMAESLEAVVVERALASRRHLPANCFLTVNLGPNSASSARVRQAFARGGDLSGLVVEITEQSPVDDYDELRAALSGFRDAGALVAVDDAGAGFASLRHVTALRPDFVKIDRALVSNLDQDPANAAIVEMMGVLSGRLDAWIIAEGVEREAELQRLIELGVPLAQGFGLARPEKEMNLLTTDTQDVLRGLRARQEQEGVGRLLEPIPSLPESPSNLRLATSFERHPDVGLIVLVDSHRRPVSFISRESFLLGGGARPISLAVQPGSGVPEVARRAIARPTEQRFDPLACCDERGALLGVVRVERLIEALAR